MLCYVIRFVRLVFFVAAIGNTHALLAADSDPAVTPYGTLNQSAPAELQVFAFLVGKWTGTAMSRDSEGNTTEYQLDWIGRYVLDGKAIADEMRMPQSEGGAVVGLSFRHYDPANAQWSIEFLNFIRSFIRKQVAAGEGAVTQEGTVITIRQPGIAGALGRERYNVHDADHFTYTLGQSLDGGKTWDDAMVVIEMTRDE